MVGVADYDVVENFDFEQLTGSNEITGDFLVGFRWSWILALGRRNASPAAANPSF